ncbi:ATP-binding protein [bacterium]|nr:ATP-binding protein [bacterium]
MAWSLSVGMKWALRNTLLIVFAVAAVATYAHFEIQRLVTRDAKLFLELQVGELVEVLSHGALSSKAIERSVAPVFDAAENPDLQIGIQVFDAKGLLVYGHGFLNEQEVRLPEDVLEGRAHSAFSELDLGGDAPYWIVSARASLGFVQFGISSHEFLASAGQLRRVFLVGAPAFLLLTMFLGWWLAHLSLRPIDKITEAARRISFSRLDQRVPIRGNRDELDRLADTLNEMIGRLEDGAGKLQRFTVDSAHQLRTPLTRLRSRLEVAVAEDETDIELLRSAISESLEEVEILSESVTATLQLAESEIGISPDHLERVLLRQLLEELVEFYEPVAREEGVVLDLNGREGMIQANPPWIQQMFSNLLNNAIRHARSRVRVTVETLQPSEFVVRIEDDGRGIEPDEIPRLFDRFYRAKAGSHGPGVGLGLPIALQMARAHGGSIDVESKPSKGSVFSVTLPRVPELTR